MTDFSALKQMSVLLGLIMTLQWPWSAVMAQEVACQDVFLKRPLMRPLAVETKSESLKADRSKSDRLLVRGGQQLSGEVEVDPAKNAYLPILAASLLNENPVRLKDLPPLRDIETFLQIFRNIGVSVTVEGPFTVIDASQIKTVIADCELIKTFRASILMLGPLLSRYGGAKVGLPGGCSIGSRPIDIHLNSLKAMGAQIIESPDHVLAEAEPRLQGAVLNFSFPSVGATQNLIMASVLADGETVINNAALEPEVDDLIEFLNKMGARITSDGRGTIKIRGVSKLLPGVEHRAIGDRIEAATYIIGALITQSELSVKGFNPTHIQAVLDTLTSMGARLEVGADYVKVLKGGSLKPVDIVTGPHPQFPTDAQAQMMALMTQVSGVSNIEETIFENRFQHAEQMNKMGANIQVVGNKARIEGPSRFSGTSVRCTDLRGGISLIINALIAEGETELSDIYFVDRGYNRFIEKFAEMGACEMSRISK